MGAIDLFDGHCDTVFQCLHGGGGFALNHCHLDLERAGTYRRYAQFFALYGQPEDFAGTALEGITHQEIFRRGAALFQREMKANAEKIIHCRSGGEANRAFSAGNLLILYRAFSIICSVTASCVAITDRLSIYVP